MEAKMQRPRFYLVLRRLVMSRRSIFRSAWLIKRKCGGGQYEDMLKGSDDPTGAHRQSKACATVVFLSTRMEAAWKEGNHSMAEYMAQRITGTIITSHSIGMLASAEILIHVMLSDDDEQRLTLLPPHQRELLAIKLHNIGKSMLKGDSRQNGSVTDGTKAQDAVKWLQKSYTIVEQLEGPDTPGIAELKIAILRSLARAYFLSSASNPENLSRAEATLQELIPTIDASKQHASSEYLELRWQRLAILKRRKAGDPAIIDAFRSIIDNMSFSETSVTDVLQELRTLNHRHALATTVNQYCLERAVECHKSGSNYVDRLLLSLIFHCSKDDDHARAMSDLETAFNHLHQADHVLPSVPTTACLTLIWQYGDRDYRAKKWTNAADWYIAGSHQVFRSTRPESSSKCLRKAALCYMEQREFAKATSVIRRCPTNEATTHYIVLLIAVHQGLDDEAIRAVQDMVKAPDFDRRMLLLATQLSHDVDMKTLLLSVLQSLLRTLKFADGGETAVEAMTLLRCIIRLILKLLVEPGANRAVLTDALVEHFQTAKTLTEAACTQKAFSIINKDVSWLWRTAYNAAIQACTEWEDANEKISDLFEIARDLLRVCCEESTIDVDGDLHLYLLNASFSALCGRVFATRAKAASEGAADDFRTVASDINICKTTINSVMNKKKIVAVDDVRRVKYFLHILRIFQSESLANLKEWDELLEVIAEITESDELAVETYEAIADILWTDKDCPVNVLYAALEAILHASLNHGSLSVEKFARWLRAICTIILSRNTIADRAKAIGYVEQAATVMEEHQAGEDPYPMDERQWLLSTSYNTGIECLHASSLDEAKRWFESATVVCRFVPDGRSLANKISETYAHLLARYSETSKAKD
ncbi:sporulation-specific protein 22, variant 2 [Pleurotus ostreatus]|nr:sporulation-specific protein 22, variant 2 [Pleurotus ostreatus]